MNNIDIETEDEFIITVKFPMGFVKSKDEAIKKLKRVLFVYLGVKDIEIFDLSVQKAKRVTQYQPQD